MGAPPDASETLRQYLRLEASMLELDARADPAADELRDRMDPLWYALSDDEQKWLDARVLEPE